MKLAENIKRIRPRTWIVVALAAVVVIGGGTTWAVLSANASSSAQAATTTTTSVAASLQTLQKTIDTSGTLAPTVQEDVDFAVAGTVTAVAVQAGSTVTAGDVLATVDTLTVQAEALTAQATLAKAQATLASAEADDDGTDTSATQIAADEASVAVAQAAADKANAAVADATLVAPVSGLVTAVNLEVGDTTSGSGSSSSSSSSSTGTGTGTGTGASGTSTSTSTSAFTIVSTDSWEVSLSVGETDVANVAVGDQVELSTDDGTAFFGTVSTVGMLPSTTSGAATYPVTVAVTGSPEGLYDGISITASIVYERRTDVLTVPSAAVTTAEDGSTTVSKVDADGNETTTTVTVGETVGTLTEITDGLAEGDLVAVTTFTPGAGNSGTGGAGTQQGTGGTGTFPGGGTMPEGFDPSQLPSGGQFPGGTTNGN